MKKILLIFTILLLIPKPGQASHVAGGEVFYEYIGDSTGIPYHYLVTVYLYRDNEGIDLGNSVTITASSSCYASLSITANQVTDGANGPNGSFLIPSLNDCIDTAQLASDRYIVHVYKSSMLLPGPCADWAFGVFPDCCKGNDIQNLSNLSNSYFYAGLNNMNGENSNIADGQITRTMSLCTNKPVQIQPFGDDPDGDSTAIRLVHPLEGPDILTDTVGFAPGYSVENPISTVDGIRIDQQNGTISFTPFQSEIVILSIQAVEYRFDSVALMYYEVGNRSVEITVSIFDSCRKDIQDWGVDDFQLESPKINCYEQWVELKSNKPFLGRSLSATDFRIVGSSGVPYPIVDAVPDNPTGYATEIRLKTYRPFTVNDTLLLYSKTGNDGNSLVNSCGFELQEDTIQLIIDNCFVSLREEQQADVHIYPNPANDILHIETNDLLIGDIKALILDQRGRSLGLHFLKGGSVGQTIDIRDLPSGLYFLRLQNKDQQISFERFTKN